MKNKKEIRFYLLDPFIADGGAITDEKFIELAEEHGKVYSMEGFVDAFNAEIISDQDYLRILKV